MENKNSQYISNIYLQLFTLVWGPVVSLHNRTRSCIQIGENDPDARKNAWPFCDEFVKNWRCFCHFLHDGSLIDGIREGVVKIKLLPTSGRNTCGYGKTMAGTESRVESLMIVYFYNFN